MALRMYASDCVPVNELRDNPLWSSIQLCSSWAILWCSSVRSSNAFDRCVAVNSWLGSIVLCTSWASCVAVAKELPPEFSAPGVVRSAFPQAAVMTIVDVSNARKVCLMRGGDNPKEPPCELGCGGYLGEYPQPTSRKEAYRPFLSRACRAPKKYCKLPAKVRTSYHIGTLDRKVHFKLRQYPQCGGGYAPGRRTSGPS